MTSTPDFDTMTMTEARAWVPTYIDHLTSICQDRALAIQIARETWTEDAKRASFAWEARNDSRSTYLPMLLAALDELLP